MSKCALLHKAQRLKRRGLVHQFPKMPMTCVWTRLSRQHEHLRARPRLLATIDNDFHLALPIQGQILHTRSPPTVHENRTQDAKTQSLRTHTHTHTGNKHNTPSHSHSHSHFHLGSKYKTRRSSEEALAVTIAQGDCVPLPPPSGGGSLFASSQRQAGHWLTPRKRAWCFERPCDRLDTRCVRPTSFGPHNHCNIRDVRTGTTHSRTRRLHKSGMAVHNAQSTHTTHSTRWCVKTNFAGAGLRQCMEPRSQLYKGLSLLYHQLSQLLRRHSCQCAAIYTGGHKLLCGLKQLLVLGYIHFVVAGSATSRRRQCAAQSWSGRRSFHRTPRVCGVLRYSCSYSGRRRWRWYRHRWHSRHRS